MQIKTGNILNRRDDGVLEIWLHSYEGLDGFLNVAEILQSQFKAILKKKISLDVELWQFQCDSNILSLIYDEGLGNILAATEPSSEPILKKVFEAL